MKVLALSQKSDGTRFKFLPHEPKKSRHLTGFTCSPKKARILEVTSLARHTSAETTELEASGEHATFSGNKLRECVLISFLRKRDLALL